MGLPSYQDRQACQLESHAGIHKAKFLHVCCWQPSGGQFITSVLTYKRGISLHEHGRSVNVSIERIKFEMSYAAMTRQCMLQLYDNACLGEWVHLLRRQNKKQLLSSWHTECLKRVHFVWKVPQQTALWHYHLHEARRYKVLPRNLYPVFNCVKGHPGATLVAAM